MMFKRLGTGLAVLMCVAAIAGCSTEPVSSGASEKAEESKATSASEVTSGAAASTPASQDGDKKTIAWITLTNTDWYAAGGKVFEECCREAGFEPLVLNGENDAQKQIDYVQSCISQGVDAMGIVPVDTAALAPIMNDAAAAGIQVYCNVDLTLDGLECDDSIVFAAFDHKAAGELCARELAEAIGGKGRVGVIAGKAGAYNVRKRSEGFMEVMEKEYPDIEVVNEIACDWDRAKAMTAAEDMLTSYPDIVGFFAMGEEMAYGAVEAAQGQGIEDMKVVCIDASSVTQRLLLEDKLVAAVECSPEWWARNYVEFTKKKLNGETLERNYDYIPRVITKETADPDNYLY